MMVILFFLASFSHAQINEIRINHSTNNAGLEWPARMAVADDGSVLVNWSGGSQLLGPDGAQVGEDLPFYGIEGNTLWFGPDRWAFLTSRDTSWSPDFGYWEGETKYFLLIRDPLNAVDSSVAMLRIWEYGNSYDDGNSYSSLFRMDLSRSNGNILFSWNMWSHYYNGTYRSTSIMPGASFLDVRDSVTVSYGVSGPSSVYDPDLGIRKYSADGIPYSYRRTRAYGRNEERAIVFHRMDTLTGKTSTVLGVDTVRGRRCGLSDHFLPYDDTHADVVLLRGTSDTLIARMYDFANNSVQERDLVAGIARYRGSGSSSDHDAGSYQDFADFAHVQLASGRHILVYSQKEASGNKSLYVAAYEKTWQMIGDPRKVSSRVVREQLRPAVALRNDTLIITWIDSRERMWGVYVKRMPLSTVVSVADLAAPELSELELYPNPVTTATPLLHVTLNNPSPRSGRLGLIDLLGRRLQTQPVDGSRNPSHYTFNTTGLRPGTYFLLYESANGRIGRKVVVEASNAD